MPAPSALLLPPVGMLTRSEQEGLAACRGWEGGAPRAGGEADEGGPWLPRGLPVPGHPAQMLGLVCVRATRAHTQAASGSLHLGQSQPCLCPARHLVIRPALLQPRARRPTPSRTLVPTVPSLPRVCLGLSSHHSSVKQGVNAGVILA